VLYAFHQGILFVGRGTQNRLRTKPYSAPTAILSYLTAPLMTPFCRCLWLIVLALSTTPSFGWIYPEHRRIALLAIERMRPEHRTWLDALWRDARRGHVDRLTETVVDPSQGLKPSRLDFAAWAAVAGDHSCSPQDMLNNILLSDWILRVADIAAELQSDIERHRRRSQHINAIRNSDIKLQRADADYATRAGSSNVHFLLARPGVDTSPSEYLFSCLKQGTELNALGAYAWFHLTALVKASRLAKSDLSDADRAILSMAALADEAFALHFLEDVYAAGHTAGTWGEASMRKGTHDFYNEKGLEVVTWDGNRFISLGDAFMRGEDAEIASATVRLSLEQLVKVATGELHVEYGSFLSAINAPDTFNVCRNKTMPNYENPPETSVDHVSAVDLVRQVLLKTPVPGLANGLGEIPRFRSEIGMFLGISGSLTGQTNEGGFGMTQNDKGSIGSIEANLRFGFGLDGVLNQAGDGLVFIQCGVRQDAASTNQFHDPYAALNIPNTSVIPGRGAYNIRLRLPFWLIPGDLLIAGPVLALTSRKTLTRMAVTAGNGGLIPWQSGIATPIGRFQFVAGREIGVSLYGIRTPQDDVIFIPNTSAAPSLVKYSSVKFDFPLLEYRPFRDFSMNQSSDILIQLSTGVDVPHDISVVAPVGDPVPQLKPVWYMGLRLIFDWRHYL
jgi:hypothetical protein